MQPENRPPMTIEEQRRRRIAERIQQMAGDDAPPITPEETPLKSDLSSIQTPFADELLSTYRDRFFAHRSSESRTTLSCDRALIDCLRRVLNALDARTSLAAYIGNILADHIDRHRALLSEAIERNRKNPFNSSLP